MATFKRFGEHYVDMEAIEFVSFYPEHKDDASYYFTKAYADIHFRSSSNLILHDPDEDYKKFKDHWYSRVVNW